MSAVAAASDQPWKVVGEPHQVPSAGLRWWFCRVDLMPGIGFGVPGMTRDEAWANAHAVAACMEMKSALEELAAALAHGIMSPEAARCMIGFTGKTVASVELIAAGSSAARALDKAGGEERR
jgi:hypothetical protein